MPDTKLFELCARISSEADPKKLAELLSELHKLLTEQDQELKQKIAQRIENLTTAPQPELEG